MKFLQGATCGVMFAATAVFAQQSTSTAATPQAPKPNTTLTIPSTTGSDVKPPEHPITLDQMKQLYADMGYDKVFEQNREMMISMQKARAPFIPADVWDDLDATSKKVDYAAAFLPVYQKYLSTEDATKVLAFAKTDAGKQFLSAIPETQRELVGVMQKEQQQVGQEVQARHKDEIEAAVKKYREEHEQKQGPTLSSPGGSSSGSSSPSSSNGSTGSSGSSTSTPNASGSSSGTGSSSGSNSGTTPTPKPQQ